MQKTAEAADLRSTRVNEVLARSSLATEPTGDCQDIRRVLRLRLGVEVAELDQRLVIAILPGQVPLPS